MIARMTRAAVVGVSLYLAAALGTRGTERAGVVRCGCGDACWCKRALLGAFRWVFPYRHRGGDEHHDHDPTAML